MNKVHDIIKDSIEDPTIYFVFSTDVIATAWSEYILKNDIAEAISTERFLAWDTFKAQCIRSEHQDKTSIPSVMRKFFAQSIIEKNKTQRLFQEIIHPAYTHTSTSFVKWVSKLLPQLASWHDKMVRQNTTMDNEDEDLLLLKNEYKAFLDTNAFFDPAWESPPFHTDGNTYYIVYPEILEDFLEYKEILENEPSICFIPVEVIEQDIEVLQFTNSRSELTNATLFIKNLCAPIEKGGKGLEWSDIAVSVKDLENFEPYIKQEFLLHNIPIRPRSGKPLAHYSAGRLFSLMQNCYIENFSFESIKNLVLDPVFPWKEILVAEQLVEFGIKNNCLCAYDGIDIWEETLKKSHTEELVSNFYKKLKKNITSIVTASNFYYVREHYIEFRQTFFTVENFTEEANSIMSRCIAELSMLIELEKNYPQATRCENPLAFYIEQLESKEYVLQGKEHGVNIFAYKLASGAPFEQHIVLDSSQNALTVSHSPLPFLREDKRKLLGIRDESKSDLFVYLYTLHSKHDVRFSCSQNSFNGFEIPLNSLKPKKTVTLAESKYTTNTKYSIENFNDAYIAEKKLFLEKSSNLTEIHSLQHKGFNNWLKKSHGKEILNSDSFLPLLHKAIQNRYVKNGKVQVSATSLKHFYECPVKWLYNKVLKIRSFSLETTLLDDVFIGTFYHEVIKRILTKYKNENKVIFVQENNELLPDIIDFIHLETNEVVSTFPESCGITDMSDLTIEIFKSKNDTYVQRLIEFFTEFSIYFKGSYVSDIEKNIILERDGYDIVGIIDCVLDYPGTTKKTQKSCEEFDGGKFIVDFKTGSKPTRKQCIITENDKLEDFQLPLYTHLYEEHFFKGKAEVVGASFFSIHEKKPTPIFGLLKKDTTYNPKNNIDQLHRTGPNTVGASFEPTLLKTQQAVESFVKTIQDESLTLFTDSKYWGHFPDGSDVSFETCASCSYRKICRTTYTVVGEII